MRHKALFAAIAAMLAGCATPQSPAFETGPARNVTDYDLGALPITDSTRGELIMSQYALASPEAKRACSPQEREFIETSLILYAVRSEASRTRPWSSDQQRAVNALQVRWTALGGDARDVSAECRSAMG